MESISLLCDCSRKHLSATREGSLGFLPCFGPWIVFSSSELSETIPVEKILVENHFPVMVDAATVADGDCGIGSKECVGVLIPVKSPPFAVNSLAVVHCSYNKRDVRWKRLKRHKKLRFRNNTAFEIKKKKASSLLRMDCLFHWAWASSLMFAAFFCYSRSIFFGPCHFVIFFGLYTVPNSNW
jgi:hypothetical protein